MNDYAGLATALLAGTGIGDLPPLVQPELLRDGRLVEVMPGWHFSIFHLWVDHLEMLQSRGPRACVQGIPRRKWADAASNASDLRHEESQSLFACDRTSHPGMTSTSRPSRSNSGCTSGGRSPMPVPASSAVARPA